MNPRLELPFFGFHGLLAIVTEASESISRPSTGVWVLILSLHTMALLAPVIVIERKSWRFTISGSVNPVAFMYQSHPSVRT